MITKLKAISSLFALLFLFSFNTQAQQNNYVKGTIILNKEKTIEGYINMDFRSPENFQTSVSYIALADYAKYQQSGKLKEKRIKPKDIVGFDLENGKNFRTVKYMDLGTAGTIGMTPKKLCLEKRVEGKIDVYKLYSHTKENVSDDLSKVMLDSKKEGDEHLIDYIQNNFQLLVQKDAGTPQNLMAVSLLNYIGDNKRVKENYTKNHYGFRDSFTDDGNSIVNKKLETSFLKLLRDYETDASSQLSR